MPPPPALLLQFPAMTPTNLETEKENRENRVGRDNKIISAHCVAVPAVAEGGGVAAVTVHGAERHLTDLLQHHHEMQQQK